MKNILKFFFLATGLLLNQNCHAQNNIPQDGDNILNTSADKFIGTWIWTNGNDSFELILKKENILLPIGNNIRADALYGFHKYIKNNVEIENSTQYAATTYVQKKSTLLAIGKDNTPNDLGGVVIIHISKNKSVKAQIDYIDANHIKLVKVENLAGTKVSFEGQPPYDSSISLPQNIILTKQ
ncbi:hypothetical protein M2347_000195 [Chryseobacterium sp. H1D6B]|uniref:DUF6705 family protein n=1 Tax=Chryseobacterium sp. H1D6B TaxID=2940588 RepID=UPI0015CCB0A2|nr:DUF6705 family protein [Chryseobacterium sp. H1D6B]MDH6250468.1 hypothetical protein [Chryseobacterium sp. H1D6B]